MRRATFWFIFGTVLLDMLALGIIAPVLPKLVIQLEGGNETRAAGLFGLFGTVWAAMQFLFAPVLGALSDRVGRRPVILVSCFGLGLDYVIMALARTVTCWCRVSASRSTPSSWRSRARSHGCSSAADSQVSRRRASHVRDV